MLEYCDMHKAHEQSIEQLARGSEKLETRVKELEETVVKLTVCDEQARVRATSQESRLLALESKPAKRWETVVTALLTAVCGGVAGHFLTVSGLI